MSIVSYGGCSIIPAPFVSITDNPIIAGNQTRIGTTYSLSIQGILITYKGSPASSGIFGGNGTGYNNQFWSNTAVGYPPDESNPSNALTQLHMMQSKQAALQSLFSQDGLTLSFQSPDGSAAFTCQPKNAEVSFEAGNWFTECKYTINLQTDAVFINGQVLQNLPATGFIQNSAESWQITPAEVIKTFNVSHTVSAQGKETFKANGFIDQPPWMNARDYVNTQLVLGWSGTSPYSTVPGSTIFGQSALGSGLINFGTYSPYNFSRTETIDELQGTYEVTETWLLALQQTSGSHVYTVSTQRIANDPYTNVVANIQGTIHGYYVDLFDYDSRIINAQYVWNQLGGPTGLIYLVEQYTNSGYNFPFSSSGNAYPWNIQPRAGSIDFDYNNGTISYQYEFTNTLYQADAFDQYTVSRKTTYDNYMTTFGIAGSIKGRRYDGDVDVAASFNRAYVYWASLSGNNYNSIYQRVLTNTYFPEASGLGISPAPANISVDMNQAEGTITYTFEFNNRIAGFDSSGYWSNRVIDEFQVSQHFSVDEGVTTYSLQGSVQGLNIVNTNPRGAKYSNATGYFFLFVQPNLYARVTGIYNVSLPNPNPLVTEIVHFPMQGNIQYTYEFRNTPAPLLSGVLSENITIQEYNYNQQINTIAIVPILGRPQGPLYQDMSTTQIKKRTVVVEAVLTPATGATLLDSFLTKPSYDTSILQLKPINAYITDWSDSWSYKTGHYSLTAEFTYQ